MARPFLTAQWRHLVMLNYAIDPAVLRPLTPAGVDLDTWQERCYVSVVGFVMRGTRVLGIPVPFHQDFDEVNLRFYVRRYEGNEVRRGVVFVREVVHRRAIAAVARWVYNENYVCETMSSTIEPNRCEYRWADCAVGATTAGEPASLVPASEEEFIAEHYYGYTRQRDGGTVEYRVDHPPWRIWPAREHWLRGDVGRFYGADFAPALARPPLSAFVAEGSEVSVWPGRRLAR